MKRLWLPVFIFLSIASPCLGQLHALPAKPFQFTHRLSTDSVSPGGTFTVTLVWTMPPGYYLYRDQLSVKPTTPSDFASFSVDVPRGVVHTDETTPLSAQVFFNELKVLVTCRVPDNLTSDLFRSSLAVGWQGCGAGVCYRPEGKTVNLQLRVVKPPSGTMPPTHEPVTPIVPSGATSPPSPSASLLFSALAAFLGGILISFTPCVFPLIPIIIAVVGIEAGRTGRLRGLGLSVSYVTGMVLVYAVLGVVAAVIGRTLVIDPRDVWVRSVAALVFVVLAASMFGLYHISLPSRFTSKLSRRPSAGVIGAFLAGVASAFLATTCVAAPLLAALAYAATTRSVLHGMLLGASFALGMGLLLILVGTFAGLVHWLTSGEWMVSVKHAMGMVLVGMAVYFLQPVLPDAVWKFSLTGFLLVAGILAMARKSASWLLKGLAVLLLLGAGVLATLAVQGLMSPRHVARPPGEAVDWIASVDDGLAQARREGKTAVIDFWATWCRECDLMDALVFSNPDVVARSRNFVMIKADITTRNDRSDALQKRFGVLLPPTIVFVNRDGTFRTLPGRQSTGEFLSNLSGVH